VSNLSAARNQNEHAAAAIVLAAVFCSSRIDAANTELFRVERNTNGNYVRYDARTRADGTLDPKAPVTAYWILPAEKGRREGLSWLEEKLAYGFSVTRAPDGFTVTLIAFDQRRVAIRRGAASWHAEVAIQGKPAVLRRIWVQASETVLGPHVEWIELSGVDRASQAALTERIVNR
jgi:hypothetical protein